MKSAVLTPVDMVEALAVPIAQMAEFIRRALEDLPPRVGADVTGRDIVLTGGGALLDRFDVALGRSVGANFRVPETPMSRPAPADTMTLRRTPQSGCTGGCPGFCHRCQRPIDSGTTRTACGGKSRAPAGLA